MAEYETIEQSTLGELAQWLDSLTWPLARDASVDRATSRGWAVIDEEDGKGDIFDTGLLTKRSWAMSNVADGEVYQLTVFTSPVVAGDAPGDQEYVAHAFSAQVQAVSAVLGAPAAEEAGVDGSATWLLTSGAALRVGRTDRSCAWKLDSPDFTQLKRDVREIESEDEDEA